MELYIPVKGLFNIYFIRILILNSNFFLIETIANNDNKDTVILTEEKQEQSDA